MTRSSRRLRWATIAWGITVFVWMGLEDNHTWPVAVLGTVSAVLMIFALVEKYRPTMRWNTLYSTLSGTAIGLTAAPITAILMFMKNAQHAHLFPDYPPEQIGAILARAPIWAAAGALIGYGISKLWTTFEESTDGKNY